MHVPRSRSHPSRPQRTHLAWGLVRSLGPGLLLLGCVVEAPEVGGSVGSSSGSTTGSDTAGTSVATGSSSSGVVDDTSAATSSTSDPADCCATHPEAACADAELAACVCKQEASCCAFAWDAECVDLAEQCGGCGVATTGDTTGSSTGDPTTGGPSGACCAPSGQPGCADDPGLETCVCGVDPFCCDNEWDGMCVDMAQSDCGLECMVGGGGDCCSADGSPGCDEPPVEDCVCALDPYCCDNAWDDICVAEAQYACMDDCGLPPAGMGDCCMAQPAPGCEDPVVTDCTCMIDGQCCLFPWSDPCIQLAVTSCGIMCEGVMPLPPCCLASMSPGCSDMVVEDCVCALDPFCCNNQWDDQCVNEAQMDCMLDCMP